MTNLDTDNAINHYRLIFIVRVFPKNGLERDTRPVTALKNTSNSNQTQ